MNFITDTHALLWWFTNSPKLSSKVSDIFASCENAKNIIFIPSIVIAEALSIFDKKRVLFKLQEFVQENI